jgi:hypothetical protein
LAALSIWLLADVIAPAYRPTPPEYSAVADAPVLATFGEQLVLTSVAVGDMAESTGPVGSGASDVPTFRPGGGLNVVLHWRVRPGLDWDRPGRDYSIFLHLVDQHGLIVAQRDSLPDSGRGLTSEWWPLETSVSGGRHGGLIRQIENSHAVYRDAHHLAVPPTVEVPCDCRLLVGVYDHETGERLRTEGGAYTLDLGVVRIEPILGPDGIPNPIGARFGDDIELAGYALSTRAVQPGETFDLTLYWRALRTPTADYKVSVQLRRGAAEKWAQHDEEPADGARPTSGWGAGEVITDAHPVLVYDEAPPDVYTLYVTVYDQETGRSLPVGYREPELSLGRFRVLAPDER